MIYYEYLTGVINILSFGIFALTLWAFKSVCILYVSKTASFQLFFVLFDWIDRWGAGRAENIDLRILSLFLAMTWTSHLGIH